MSARRADQVATFRRRFRHQRSRRRGQPRARPVRAAAVAGRKLGRRLRRSARRSSTTGCRGLRRSGLGIDARDASSTISPTSLQALSTTPESLFGAHRRLQLRAGADAAAQRHDRAASRRLRSDAELGISDAVRKRQRRDAARSPRSTSSSAASNPTMRPRRNLLDQRDNYIDQLSQLMDIKVVNGDHNQVTVFTNSGIQLVGTHASTLTFDAQGTMTPTAQWSADPTKRNRRYASCSRRRTAAMSI